MKIEAMINELSNIVRENEIFFDNFEKKINRDNETIIVIQEELEKLNEKNSMPFELSPLVLDSIDNAISVLGYIKDSTEEHVNHRYLSDEEANSPFCHDPISDYNKTL